MIASEIDLVVLVLTGRVLDGTDSQVQLGPGCHNSLRENITVKLKVLAGLMESILLPLGKR